MPKSVSPPISPRTIRHPKRPRAPSRDEISVEELDHDENGYDADVEVLHPDQYEEPESDLEEPPKPTRCITDIDEEITRGMKQLGWRGTSLSGSVVEGQGRESAGVDSSPINRYGKRPEFDVAAFAQEKHPAAPPAKRRKNRDSRSTIMTRFMKATPQSYTDSSGRADGKGTTAVESSTTSTASSEAPILVSGDEMVLD